MFMFMQPGLLQYGGHIICWTSRNKEVRSTSGVVIISTSEQDWAQSITLTAVTSTNLLSFQRPVSKEFYLTLLSPEPRFIWNDWKDAGKTTRLPLCSASALRAALSERLTVTS